ncbi:MAG: yliI [Proteobacteria bacterium]|nr:yliI [Pseudomonadota bacterium]
MKLKLAFAATLLAGCSAGTPESQAQERLLETEAGPLRVSTVASGLEHPWSLAFLPDGRMLVTERPGRLRIVAADGALSAPVAGVPAVHAVGQGGLLDVALDPDFAANGLVYLSYAEPGKGGLSGTAVARGRLAGGALEDVRVIFRQQPKVDSEHHYGSRLVFARDGRLFVTLGDRGSQRRLVHDPATHIGKVLRIERDGSVPADNPWAGRKDAAQEVFSWGHRNVQGATLHPQTGELWTHEHGPRGGDEVNITRRGLDYGWPVITYGREYHGPSIGEGSAKAGMEQPLHYWVPSIAPSGMAFYTGAAIPAWQGHLLVGALAAMQLVRLELSPDNRVTHEERIGLGERIRDVRQGPDGAVYLLTDTGKASRVLRLARD